jgi:hypothetical protein
LLCRSIQDKNGNCASANQNIRKVNAALYIASIEPPAFFGPEKPLDNREHYALHNNLLSGSELKTMSAEKISWAAAATNTQAQYLAFYYFVRTHTHTQSYTHTVKSKPSRPSVSPRQSHQCIVHHVAGYGQGHAHEL